MVVEAGAIFNGKCQMGDINQIKKMMSEQKDTKTENNFNSKTENSKEEVSTSSVFSDLKI